MKTVAIVTTAQFIHRTFAVVCLKVVADNAVEIQVIRVEANSFHQYRIERVNFTRSLRFEKSFEKLYYSGGPLLVNGIEVGIVSWSVKPCAVAPYPGVYTQVSYYREWIRQVTRV